MSAGTVVPPTTHSGCDDRNCCGKCESCAASGSPIDCCRDCPERYTQQTQPPSMLLTHCSLLNHDSTLRFLLFLFSVMPSSVIVHVEVRLLSSTNIRLDSVSRWVYDWLQSNFISLSICQEITSFGNVSWTSPPFFHWCMLTLPQRTHRYSRSMSNLFLLLRQPAPQTKFSTWRK